MSGARREEMQAKMRELLSTLDGSRAARIAMLAGMTREEQRRHGPCLPEPPKQPSVSLPKTRPGKLEPST